METRTLKNTAGIAQSIVFGGKQLVLGPFAEEAFSADVAKKFLELRAPVVVDTSDNLGEAYAPDIQASTVWIANITGNPDAPATIKEKVWDARIRKRVLADVPNPNKEPRTLTRELKGGHHQYFGSDGKMWQETLPGKTISVPPFRRRPLPAAEAEWFIGRDQKSTGLTNPAVIRSRPQSDFEPDMKWKLDDMRVYFRLVAPDADLGPDAQTILNLAKAEVEKEGRKEKWGVEKIDQEIQARAAEELRKAKQELFKRLYFYLVNPDYPLPTKAEYNEFVSGKSNEEIASEELADLLAKSDRVAAKKPKQEAAQA